jgi:hypothetical protein
MTIRSRWQGGMLVACLAATGLVAGATPQVTAQPVRDNPLRPAAKPTAEEPPPVRQAQFVHTPQAPVRRPAHGSPATVAPARRGVHAPTSYGGRATRQPTRGFVPPHQLVSDEGMDPEGLYFESAPMGQPEYLDYGYPSGDPSFEYESSDSECCDQGLSDCGDCGACRGCLIPCPHLMLDNFELFTGVQGFTAPLNRGESAGFGFHYGVNWAAPVPCMPNQPIGMQIGWRGVSSNYSGASFTEDSRNQSFLTAGLFRRVDWGIQGGVVIDFLSDQWYYEKLNLVQLRGELSWMFPQSHELGFWFSSGTNTGEIEPVVRLNGRRFTLVEEYEPTDLMAFFYRRRFDAVGGGYGRLFGGFSGHGEGLIGADFALPLTENWALRTGFTYLIPKDGDNRVAYLEEAWNVGISLVWYPGQRKSVGNDYFRPLLDVADNGSFIVRRR